MLFLEEVTVTNSEVMPAGASNNWFPFLWCLPALLGFLAFLLAFPIDRRIPHWFPLNIAEIFALWFLFITPVTTVIAIVTLVKRNQKTSVVFLAKLVTWTAIVVSLIMNALILLGMWASTY